MSDEVSDDWKALLEYLLSAARRDGDAANLYPKAVALHRELAVLRAHAEERARQRDEARADLDRVRLAYARGEGHEEIARELAVLRAQLAPLLAVHDALVAAAALPGAGASGEEMVAAVRAQGAVQMRADLDASEAYLAGIVRAWQRASDEDRHMADVFVSGMRREIEEARDSRQGAWWEVSR